MIHDRLFFIHLFAGRYLIIYCLLHYSFWLCTITFTHYRCLSRLFNGSTANVMHTHTFLLLWMGSSAREMHPLRQWHRTHPSLTVLWQTKPKVLTAIVNKTFACFTAQHIHYIVDQIFNFVFEIVCPLSYKGNSINLYLIDIVKAINTSFMLLPLRF